MASEATGDPGMRKMAWKVLRKCEFALFTITHGLVLLIFVIVAILAVRSYWVQDLPQIAYQWYSTPVAYHARWFAVRSLRGTLTFGV
ncbi:MAG: hypothetical protein IT440_08155, partial [Phycisphaeraceae bacterium]|nr:hypothetical protein [Phycisphaeraceae bacterium]